MVFSNSAMPICYAFQGLNSLGAEMSHFVAHDLQPDATSVVDVADYSAPGLDALENVGLLEDGLGFARQGVAEESQYGAVQRLCVVRGVAVPVGGGQTVADGFPEAVVGDWPFLPFSPAEELIDRRDT